MGIEVLLRSYPRAKLDYYASKIRKIGPIGLSGWILKRIVSEIVWLLLLPLAVTGHLLGFRRYPANTSRIGHLAAEVDAFLKDQTLGNLGHKRWFLLAPKNYVANASLLEYWAEHLPVVRNPFACAVLSAMSRHGLMSQNVRHYILALRGTATYYAIQSAWGNRPPLLQLTQKHQKMGWDCLRNMGIPSSAWFVAIHVREGGFSEIDEAAHSHRNGSIDRLLPTIHEIRRRGGWVIRMGDPTVSRLPSIEGFVDYAHHPSRSDWMDVFLCAECRFFLGNSSGLFIVSTAFGVPCALVNMIPTSHLGYSVRDLSIPKLIWSKAQNRYLTFPEIFAGDVANFRLAKLFEYSGLIYEENTADEIRELATEMMDRQANDFITSDEDELLQERFKRLLKPGHYAFGTSSRVGSAFLRHYESLL